ncbi:MAG TPA: hypothetical protein VHC96_19505 [Puia sp.]|jgi:hypothetical protein|nr:hypothetical protein [Puia sp.]
MATSTPPKEHRLNLRLSEQEWNKIHKLASNTTCRSVSEYCRKVLLREPVIVYHRNQSFDNFEEDLAPLLPILKTFGEDFNTLIQGLSGDNSTSANIMLDVLLLRNRQFLDTTTRIKELLTKITDTCSQK